MAAYPETPRRLRGHQASSPDSWVTVIFGVGSQFGDLTPVLSADATGTAVPFELKNTRWNETWTRLARLLPASDLEPGAWYTLGVPVGAAGVADPRRHPDRGG